MKKTFIFMVCTLSLFSFNSYAEFDVDDADSLDFESFHNDEKKNNAEEKKSLWDKLKKKTSTKPMPLQDGTSALKKTNNNTSQATKQLNNESILHIQERYTLSRSDHTPYSAFYVVEALHKKMAVQCPSGWNKIKEWSTPVEGDFFLHYQFSCR
jgi:hypothetical protein